MAKRHDEERRVIWMAKDRRLFARKPTTPDGS